MPQNSQSLLYKCPRINSKGQKMILIEEKRLEIFRKYLKVPEKGLELKKYVKSQEINKKKTQKWINKIKKCNKIIISRKN